MIAIWKRELRSYLTTPTGYVFAGVFLCMGSIMFYLSILQTRSSDLLTFMGQLSYLWMLLCPVLTMRLLAQERQKQTDQLLFTCPVSLTGVVLGKYLAAVTLMLATVLLCGLYALVVGIYGKVYPGQLMVAVLGFVLQGCAFISVDLLVSACCKAPVTSAVISIGVNLCLWIMDLVATAAPVWLDHVMSFLSLYARNEPFLMGQLSFASVGYDLSLIAAMLVLTIHVLDRRRCKGV